MNILLKIKPPFPCHPNNPHCNDIPPSLPINGFLSVMIIIAIIYGYMLIKNYNHNELK